MPNRQVHTIVHPSSGLIFGFWPDRSNPGILHITARHQTTPADAISTFFTGQTIWDEEHKRFATFSATHGLYWFWWEKDHRVGVITCFRLEET